MFGIVLSHRDTVSLLNSFSKSLFWVGENCIFCLSIQRILCFFADINRLANSLSAMTRE